MTQGEWTAEKAFELIRTNGSCFQFSSTCRECFFQIDGNCYPSIAYRQAVNLINNPPEEMLPFIVEEAL